MRAVYVKLDSLRRRWACNDAGRVVEFMAVIVLVWLAKSPACPRAAQTISQPPVEAARSIEPSVCRAAGGGGGRSRRRRRRRINFWQSTAIA